MMDHGVEKRLLRTRAWCETHQPLEEDESAVLARMEQAHAAVLAYRKQQAGQPEEAMSG